MLRAGTSWKATTIAIGLAFVSVGAGSAGGMELRSVRARVCFPATARAGISRKTRLPHYESADRCKQDWGVELDWNLPVRADIYYGQLPAAVDHYDYDTVGDYREEFRVDYASAAPMFRVPVFRSVPGPVSTDRAYSVAVYALIGPRIDLYLPYYVAGPGDLTGWANGGPRRCYPVLYNYWMHTIWPVGLGAEAALSVDVVLNRLVIAPELRLHGNITSPSTYFFVLRPLVPAATLGIGLTL